MCFSVSAVWTCGCVDEEESVELECSEFPHCGCTGLNGEERVKQVIQARGVCSVHKNH